MAMTQQQPVALVVGGSRGIGRQVAVDLAKDGYTVVVAGKSTTDNVTDIKPFPPDPDSPQSTVSTVAREIREAGGTASAVAVDTRDYDSVVRMVEETVRLHERIDALVYNSGAIWWASVEKTPFRRFQLMQRVNVEGLYATLQACMPVWRAQGWRARVVVVSPPVYSRFFRGKAAYAAGKVGMSVIVKGLAMDWDREGKDGMAAAAVWPASAIRSGATRGADARALRHPSIFSHAVLAMLRAPRAAVNGRLDTDEDFLREQCGVREFGGYALVAGSSPRRIMPAEFPDLRVAEQDDEGDRIDSSEGRRGGGGGGGGGGRRGAAAAKL